MHYTAKLLLVKHSNKVLHVTTVYECAVSCAVRVLISCYLSVRDSPGLVLTLLLAHTNLPQVTPF